MFFYISIYLLILFIIFSLFPTYFSFIHLPFLRAFIHLQFLAKLFSLGRCFCKATNSPKWLFCNCCLQFGRLLLLFTVLYNGNFYSNLICAYKRSGKWELPATVTKEQTKRQGRSVRKYLSHTQTHTRLCSYQLSMRSNIASQWSFNEYFGDFLILLLLWSELLLHPTRYVCFILRRQHLRYWLLVTLIRKLLVV